MSYDTICFLPMMTLIGMYLYSFTVVHPVPTFDNTTQLMQVLDRMEEGTFSPPSTRSN